MKNLYKQKRQQGFTIIEVMIVLAIAAVILTDCSAGRAVTFCKVAARNTQRKNDVSKLAWRLSTRVWLRIRRNNNSTLPARVLRNQVTFVDDCLYQDTPNMNYYTSDTAANITWSTSEYRNPGA